MCGIGFIQKMAQRPIQEVQIRQMALALEYRGNDATGFALVDQNGTVEIFKNDDPAWRLVGQKSYRSWINQHLKPSTRLVLVHTRKATKGTFHKNANNHPLTAGKGSGVVIHNGWINNDDALFEANKKQSKAWQRSAETDSDVIRALLDNYGGVDEGLVEDMNKLEGVAAVAAWHPATPTKLLLLRDSNPLMLGATADYLAGASDKESLFLALKPFVKRHNFIMQVHAPDLSFVPMPNESAWIIGPQGWEAHLPFRCNDLHRMGNLKYAKNTDYVRKHGPKSTRPPVLTEPPNDDKEEPQNSTAPSQDSPQANSGAHGPSGAFRKLDLLGLPKFVICPNNTCSAHLEIEEQYRMAQLDQLICRMCRTNLAGALKAVMET